MIKKPFKVVYNGGRYNGAVRYFSNLASALRSSRRYIRFNSDIPEYIYCEVFFLVFSGSHCYSKKLICEID